jgi:hypothetical protein
VTEFDVIVVGAGPAGTAAALAAARGGCSALLVEKGGFCGGMATAGMVNPFMGNHYRNPETGRDGDLAGGLYAEILARLGQYGAHLRFRYSRRDGAPFGDAFDDAWLRIVYDRLIGEAGVNVLLHTTLIDARVAGERLQAIRVLTKAGIREFSAASFIDATGDGDLAAAAGLSCAIGRPQDGLCQPASTMFRMGGVDKPTLFAEDGLRSCRASINTRFREARERGRLDSPLSVLGVYEFPRPGVLHFNATRIGGAPALDSEERTRLEIEGRRQVAELACWLRSEVAGFENSFLESVASHVGIRETRRLVGRYVLSGRDIAAGQRFPDGIARSAYHVDIHAPKAGERDGHVAADGKLKEGFKPERYYEVPLRCLQSERLSNALVACRALATDHYAHAATRVMVTMTAVGEAAGRAVVLAGQTGVAVGEIDGAAVRRQLAYLDASLSF